MRSVLNMFKYLMSLFEIHLFIVQEYEEDDGEFLKLEETESKDGFFDEDYKVVGFMT